MPLANAALQPPRSPQGIFCLRDLHVSPPPRPQIARQCNYGLFCRARWVLEETAVIKAPFHLLEGLDKAAAEYGEQEQKELKILSGPFSPLPHICHSLGKGSCLHAASFQINS